MLEIDVLRQLQHPLVPILAGAWGVLLSSFRWAPTESAAQILFSLFFGVGCLLFGAPYLLEHFNTLSLYGQSLVCFVVGLGAPNIGLKMIDKLTKWVVDTPFWTVIRAFLPSWIKIPGEAESDQGKR